MLKDREEIDVNEMKGLVEALGGEVVGLVFQKRKSLHPATYIGKGKLEEVKRLADYRGADAVVVYHNISSSQIRNIERITGLQVLDRSEIIIEIFARRAKTKEAKVQVELAKCYHLLSRLRGKGKELSRLGGGIGTRGPGEKKVEIDLRAIRRKMYKLQKEIEKFSKRKKLVLDSRKKKGFVTVAVTGYTNVGKSTLVRKLTGEDIFIKDMPFATLDTRTGSIYLKNAGKKALITDTVGFIKDIPHELIASFKATLQEVAEADIVVVVYDVTSPSLKEESETVEKILSELGASKKPRITVINKIDKTSLNRDEIMVDVAGHIKNFENPVFLSAVSGEGMDEFFEKLEYVVSSFF
ncbi:GTPase HflX [Desulfurobacterium atlanticum]|uniref:GTPase HflX n=1 Tax=Desulfurobacterium atlanticum TaxID=240169 RepID=A0A238XJQ2_9BACT|nr:GTPase HflX [Desulfurobacterium atlanticum]SNR58818.1 GTP-binding protein HflX [Desulfurobacterium atlanticum]